MGDYQIRDLLRGPSLVSLVRLPLAGLFVAVSDRPEAASAVMLASGISDVIDGFWARHFDRATPTGAVVDGAADKAFAATVVVTLLVQGRLDPWGAIALGVREALELPLVVWWGTHRAQRKARAEDPQANWMGKAATVLQFAAVVATLYQSPLAAPLLMVTFALGVLAAARYWQRELSAAPPWKP